MAQISRSYHGDAPGSKSEELKKHFDLHLTLIFDALNNTNNSIKLVDPSVLKSLFEETCVTLNQINWETVSNESKPKKGPTKTTNTNITEMAKIKKRTTLDTKNVEDETTLNIKKDEEPEVLEFEESIGKHADEWEATLNKAQSIKSFSDSQQYLLGNEKPSTSTKTPNESNSKTSCKKLKSKEDPTCKTESALEPNDVSAESTSSTDGNRVETSANIKKKEIEAARKDFSIENVDWYYKDENNYKKECCDTLSCFIADGYDKAYTYLLLDPRILEDKSDISWLDFINAIFYIGKGMARRAFQHATDTEKWLKNGKPFCLKDKKFRKIEEIWKSAKPFKIFKIKGEMTEYEAYTREAAMIDAIGVDRLCNEERGHYHKQVKNLEARKCLELGVTLLLEAWDIFKREKPDVVDVKPKKKEFLDLFFG